MKQRRKRRLAFITLTLALGVTICVIGLKRYINDHPAYDEFNIFWE